LWDGEYLGFRSPCPTVHALLALHALQTVMLYADLFEEDVIPLPNEDSPTLVAGLREQSKTIKCHVCSPINILHISAPVCVFLQNIHSHP